MIRNFLYICAFLIGTQFFFAQTGQLSVDAKLDSIVQTDEEYDPLRPAKAAFYSAVIPGLGQAYNKRYWKIPIIYGAIGTSLYYYSINNTQYKRFRRAFKQRAAGQVDEFADRFSTQSLESAQRTLRSNRDTSLLLVFVWYGLQILEASIDAHLLQFNISDNITFDPRMMKDINSDRNFVGLSLNINL